MEKVIQHGKRGFYKTVGKGRVIVPNNIKFPKEPYVYFDVQGSDVILEDYVVLSHGIYVYTHTHRFKKIKWRKLPIVKNPNPTILKRNCFLGTNVILLHTCKYIGISSVIATGAVVTKDVPDYEIWGGNPAKKIGEVER